MSLLHCDLHRGNGETEPIRGVVAAKVAAVASMLPTDAASMVGLQNVVSHRLFPLAVLALAGLSRTTP